MPAYRSSQPAEASRTSAPETPREEAPPRLRSNTGSGESPPTNPPTNPPPKNRRKPTKLRWAIWILEATILLAAIEQFIIRPRLAGRKRPLPDSITVQLVADPLTPLGDAATLPPGLFEVVPAYRAPLTGLAPGSAAMAQAQVAYARETGFPVDVRNSIGMRLRLVPPGTALIGSPENEMGRQDWERQHVAAVPEPFYLGVFEVTQAEYAAIMGSNPAHFKGPNHPVEEVTWYDCQRFLLALCKREGVPAGTYRLPTETEWEYACRAGTTSAYHFGDDPGRLPLYADFAGNNFQGTAAVGQRPPNALGLHNMHGNVWEWCLDRFHAYPGDERSVGERNQWRNLRGGNWYEPAEHCRSANRANLPPASHGNMLGFRVLRSLSLAQEEPPQE